MNFKIWFRKLCVWLQKFKLSQVKVRMETCYRRIQLRRHMTLEMTCLQGQGSRAYQQDYFGFSKIKKPKQRGQKDYIVVVADGMGGMLYGDEISKLVVQKLLEQKMSSHEEIDQQLKEMASTISSAIYERFEGLGGSTVIMTYIDGNQLHWVSVGDSHLYIKRQNKLYLMNEEHNYLSYLYYNVLKGYLTLEEARNHKSPYGLTQFMGKEKLTAIEGSYKGFTLQDQDIICICTDGVSDTLSDKQINALLTKDVMESAKAITNQIIVAKNEYQDNFTAVIMKWSGENGV